jgi:hypothetical protein
LQLQPGVPWLVGDEEVTKMGRKAGSSGRSNKKKDSSTKARPKLFEPSEREIENVTSLKEEGNKLWKENKRYGACFSLSLSLCVSLYVTLLLPAAGRNLPTAQS